MSSKYGSVPQPTPSSPRTPSGKSVPTTSSFPYNVKFVTDKNLRTCLEKSFESEIRTKNEMIVRLQEENERLKAEIDRLLQGRS